MLNGSLVRNYLNFYFSLEEDLNRAFNSVEPEGQYGVFSYDFYKIIILSMTLFENICTAMTPQGKNEPGEIGDYKGIILNQYPKIYQVKVNFNRGLSKEFQPYKEWEGNGKLSLWSDVYQCTKHAIKSELYGIENEKGHRFYMYNLYKATCENALLAMGMVYVLLLYIVKGHDKINFCVMSESKIFCSNYVPQKL